MNILQSLKTPEIYNVTLNPPRPIQADKVIRSIEYHHPVFTIEGVEKQRTYSEVMGQQNTFFCGAYPRNGFHEDGVVTAEAVCQSILGEAV